MLLIARTTRRRVAGALGAATLVVLLSLAAAPPAPAGQRLCGRVVAADGAPFAVMVLRGPASCRTARQVLRAYFDSDAACGGSSCVRRLRGWPCQAAEWEAFPRLALCSTRRARVAAFSYAA